MKLRIVITAAYADHNVTVWLDPAEMVWDDAARLWRDKHATTFDRRRTDFSKFGIETGPGEQTALPKHGSMDAVKVVLIARVAEALDPVSYLKPRESLGEF